MDRTRAHLGGFSWTSGIPPCKFRGNTFIDKPPRWPGGLVGGALGIAGPFGQQGFYVRLDVNGGKAVAVPAHRHAVLAHQELLEVLGHVIVAHTWETR